MHGCPSNGRVVNGVAGSTLSRPAARSWAFCRPAPYGYMFPHIPRDIFSSIFDDISLMQAVYLPSSICSVVRVAVFAIHSALYDIISRIPGVRSCTLILAAPALCGREARAELDDRTTHRQSYSISRCY